jgi:hypothetical protein
MGALAQFQALTAARSGGGAGPVAVTWDPNSAALNGAVALTNGNLTGTETSADPTGAVTLTTAIASGKAVAKVTLTAAGDPVNDLYVLLLAGADPETATETFGFFCDGTAFHDPDNPDLGRPIPSGSNIRLWINQVSGKMWMGNDAGGPAGDPEAGTGEAFAFTPGTPLWLRVGFTAIGAAATLDPTYSSGSYAALNP